ncbi:N-fatty-acyl-amino acid synthase/hydrolase PM20D1 isoform X2 [Meriones unguiculatus]|uniref:N-fatty-acyl-amino acid synthase/hydrolase PM20D1 isoform X2 n=1 Tax=Meriones unguiculatus TaxID=10047 RepID=UPI00293E5CDE|nr:N-fatty-acyl-amino acid synthase/hydrolase PM20D1 isoform X2 [Meriones unguiculatus]
MAGRVVNLPAQATALLLFLACVFGSTDPRSREIRGASRIPSQFSEEECMAIKEALKGAIQIPTVSFSPEKSNTTALAEFGDYIHKGQLQTEGQGWQTYTGDLDKAILQALELLLTRNYRPRRSFFIALGHDEEVYGLKGARQIASLLQARGVKLAFLVDEGSFILEGFIPKLKKPVAMISVTVKGILDLMLQVNMTPGHSSAPPKETSIGILSAAVSRLEKTPMPNMFGSGPLEKTLNLLANEFSFPTNIVLKNLWLFRPIVSRLLEKNHITNALIRTTAAPTMFNAGVKENVIPPLAQATINFRIHPSQTMHEVLELVKKTMADDRIQMRVLRFTDPVPISPSDDQALGYQLLQQTIKSVFPEVNIVVPGICIANADCRHYANITNGIYLFNPVFLQPEGFSSIHGINEKISVQSYQNQVKFIFELMQNADTNTEPVPHLHEL